MRRFVRDENGQALALFALLFTVLLGFTALAIDTGMMTYEKTRMQKAADAAAIAGAYELPNEGLAKSTAVEYAGLNGSVIDTSKVRVFNENGINKVEVNLVSEVQSPFARTLEFAMGNVNVVAVAAKEEIKFSTMFDYTLFSGDGNLILNGNKFKIYGDVYGDQKVDISGNDERIEVDKIVSSKEIDVKKKVTIPPENKIIKKEIMPTIPPTYILQNGTELINAEGGDYVIPDGASFHNGMYYFDGNIQVGGTIEGPAIIYATGDIKFPVKDTTVGGTDVVLYTGRNFDFGSGNKKLDILGILYAPKGGDIAIPGAGHWKLIGKIYNKGSIDVNGAEYGAVADDYILDGLEQFDYSRVKLVK